MSYTKTIKIILFIGFFSIFKACAPRNVPVSEGGYYHSGLFFGIYFPAKYKKGIQDGCTTAKGEYKKSHSLFKTNKDYNTGWFLGRNRCRKLLVINEDGK